MAKAVLPKCVNAECGRPVTLDGLRGLCVHCYVDPEIRDRTAVRGLLAEGKPKKAKGMKKPKRKEKPLPPPTDVPPGPDRVEVLEARVKGGYALWHPLDATGDSRQW
jgi:hypothetical protein